MRRFISSWPGGNRALDLVNFFVADVQTGFGPFVAVYLTTHKWTQVEIGFALTVGTVTALVSQLPAGALVDAMRNKRLAAAGALIFVIIAALLLATLPTPLPVLVAQILHGFASCVITPAIAAISLHVAGHAALGERLGRNARFASIGNGLAAAVMGVTGSYFSSRFVFLLTAALCVPALFALWSVGAGAHARTQTTSHGLDLTGLKRLVTDHRLMIFAVCVMLFHLSNAAMLPLAGAMVTMRAGDYANLIIAACIVVPQMVVAALSPWIGRAAEQFGRRRLMLLGWGALPLRGLLLAVLPGAWPLIFGQAVSGISAAAFGVLMPLLAADLTLGSAHFNLCMGMLGLAVYIGAAISTTLSGGIADAAGMQVAFFALSGIGVLAFATVWLVMPETRPARDGEEGRLASVIQSI
ncbi:MFS transporter [Rhodopila globiformis]|uniref:MFS transporter n=1 Tax=Rhodopila globiformis TaxID=1071 RepID=A0A2S6NIR1_RHOGL|nr:MFS transporter [Rhodopila globiformis]PPQ34551.1 MFS transporter [Rhodopila globiformis]